MNRPKRFTLTATALLFLGVAGLSGAAVDQQDSATQQIVGTWPYVSVDTVRPDGSRVPMFGPTPRGLAIFDGNGRYVLMTSRADLPRFASNNRTEGTPEEYKAVVQGLISHFGRYAVNDTDKTITFSIENSSFPNWNGAEQKRPFSLSGDELKWTTVGSNGSLAEVVLKRAH